jgi:glutamine synthetase
VVAKDGSLDEALTALVGRSYKEHSRVVFNGNNYAPEWKKEAKKRGLLNLQTTVDAVEAFSNPVNIELFEKYGIFTKSELESRKEIVLECYNKTVNIEALTMLDMVKTQVIPAVATYSGDYAASALQRKNLCSGLDVSEDETFVAHLNSLLASLHVESSKLEKAVSNAAGCATGLEKGLAYSKKVLPCMNSLRAVADECETLVAGSYWKYPTYSELLFST